MAEFSSILDRSPSEVRFPKLPVGSYVGVVKGMPRYDKSAKKQTPFVEYKITLVEALEDVDADALEDFGPISDKELPITFYYENEPGFKRLVAFLDNCGVDDEGTLRQRCERAPGSTIVVEIKHTPSQSGDSFYAQIDGTAKYGS